MIEHFHRQLKPALQAQHNPIEWMDALPLVLLGIRSAVKHKQLWSRGINVVQQCVRSLTFNYPMSTFKFYAAPYNAMRAIVGYPT